ncbi:type II 3-dehydroquinate dehydratase [Fodinicurvata sediminis]|uniref:type II 3-dehydroquinate dehydratase n=1 Tax=Fodinicurvata sediminis TaxID=1121832 RepID=UPI0004178A1F|nr:type II 3-dehydroquinate dehydratase [Fodinicurvata sediminis]
MASLPHILVLNGPNLNLLGTREPDVYGKMTLSELESFCRTAGEKLGLEVSCNQSNHEGELVGWIQQARDSAQGLVLNPAGYSHTSVALRDAIAAVGLPLIEVHLSNIHKRESFRHHSYVSAVAEGVICGLGVEGYRLALQALAQKLKG